MGGVMVETQHRASDGIGGGRPGRIAPSLTDVLNRLQARRITAFCFFQVSFLLAYKYGMDFGNNTASPFWFPDSVLLCALLLAKPRVWWILLMSTLPGRYLLAVHWNLPGWFLLATFLNDCGKALLVAWVLRRRLKNPLRFGNVAEYGLFCAVAVLIAPALSALGGAACRHVLGAEFWTAWQQWFFGDAATHLIVTPVILYGFLGNAAQDWKRLLKRWREVAPLLAALILASHSAFHMSPGNTMFSQPMCYAPIPLLFWAAVRFGMLGASMSMLIIEIFSVVPIFHGHTHAAWETGDMLALRDLMFLAGAPFYLVAILGEQNRGVELSLMESEVRFRNIADTAPAMLWTADTTKSCDFVNSGWLEFTGHTLEEEKGIGWAHAIHPDDRARCLEIYESHFDLRAPFEMEYRLRRHDGEYRWVLDYGRPRYDSDGNFAGYIGSAMDITERKRGEELADLLAQAQEEERRRIARDLHDDFSQRLAAHAIALSNLKHYIIDRGADIPALATRVDKLQGQAAALGEAIRLIAHELHPSSIEQRGLEGALQSLCKEFRTLSRLRIDLRIEGSTKGLSPNLVVCCFRVAQEGLRNVVKHAHASEVLVKVTVGVNRLSLEVADNGVGLNGHARRDRGMGISSMRERVELLAGTFRIASREPHGTIVTAQFPAATTSPQVHKFAIDKRAQPEPAPLR